MDVKHNKNLIYFIYQQKTHSSKCKIANTEKLIESVTRPLQSHITIKRKSHKKDVFYRNFPLFVLQLSLFKTYPHTDANVQGKKKPKEIDLNCFTNSSKTGYER
jgi:hypothetical protein